MEKPLKNTVGKKMIQEKTAALLFSILVNSFERNDIKAFHAIIGGVRAVIEDKTDGKQYQVTLREIVESQEPIDLDDMAQKQSTGFQYGGMTAKKKN